MANIEPVHKGALKRRVTPALTTFVVAAVGIYATVWVGLGLLRHVVMPIIAIGAAGYLAVHVYQRTGRRD